MSEKTVTKEPKVNPQNVLEQSTTLYSVAKAEAQWQKSMEEREAFLEEMKLSSQQRTQLAADEMFPNGKHRYEVSLSTEKSFPLLEINADTPRLAEMQYRDVCGIREVEGHHKFSVKRL